MNASASPYTAADYEKIPSADSGWTHQPDRENNFVIAVRCIRFSDGTTRKYYQQVPKPLSKKETKELRRKAKKILQFIREDDREAGKRRASRQAICGVMLPRKSKVR
jgi:hypothetical protein